MKVNPISVSIIGAYCIERGERGKKKLMSHFNSGVKVGQNNLELHFSCLYVVIAFPPASQQQGSSIF